MNRPSFFFLSTIMRKAAIVRTFLLLALVFYNSAPTSAADWTHVAADAHSTRYAPLAQIDRDNFAELEVAWRFALPDMEIIEREDFYPSTNRGTPLVVDGVLYYGTPLGLLVAVDAANGEGVWTFDPEPWDDMGSFVGNLRGIAYWADGDQRRILYVAKDTRLYSIDAETGQPDPAFGDGGSVDLTRGLRRRVDRERYGVTAPPVICRGVVVVGSAISDWHYRAPSKYTNVGDVRGFDVRTGEQLWTFHTIPQEGEYGNETWENEAWKTYGGANAWAALSADEALGYVYVPTGSVSQDIYGGERPGDNLFGESLLCLDAASGERVWHFQAVHHGMWNYDLPAPPVLIDIEVDGQPIKAVAQVGKQAFCYVLDRVSGEPVWPIKERKVPQSNMPGEKSSPTQPFPTRPAAFDRQGLQEDDLIDFTPELRQRALEIIADYDYGSLYIPPTEKGIIQVPGQLGGTDWAGGAFHPGKRLFYVPSRTLPSILDLSKARNEWNHSAYAMGYGDNLQGPEGLPLFKPPYGRITAIDMASGEHAWVSPVGRGPVDHPALAGLDLPDLGWNARIFTAVTSTLLLTTTRDPRKWIDRINPVPYLHALDLDSGALLGRVELPGWATGNLMTYETGGRQYIVMALGGDGDPYELVALALP